MQKSNSLCTGTHWKSLCMWVCKVRSRAAAQWVLNRLSICLCVFKLSYQSWHLHSVMDTQVLSSIQPLPIHSQSSLHTPCLSKHCHRNTFLQDATLAPAQNGPFHSRGGPVQLKTQRPASLFCSYTLTHLTSLPCWLCLFLFTDAEDSRIQLSIYVFPLEFYNHALSSSSSFSVILEAVSEQHTSMFAHTSNAWCRSCIYVTFGCLMLIPLIKF